MGRKLDIWRPEGPGACALCFSTSPAAVGCLVTAVGQGYALLSRLVAEGWICVAIDYRTSPHASVARALPGCAGCALVGRA
jgi:hypothetical protein